MEKAEYLGNEGCPQRDSTECEEYAGVRSIDERRAEEADGADLLEQILDRDNLNRAYKRVKANKGIHLSTCEVLEESQRQTSETDFPQSRKERPHSDGER